LTVGLFKWTGADIDVFVVQFVVQFDSEHRVVFIASEGYV